MGIDVCIRKQRDAVVAHGLDSYIALSAHAIKESVSSASIVHTTPMLALSWT